MNKHKYKASWVATIELYPIVSETKNRVCVGYDNYCKREVSYNKETQSDKWCDSFEEAKEFLVNKHKKSILELEKALKMVKEDLARAESLTEDMVKEIGREYCN